MARPTKYATPICLGLTALAIIGIIVGLMTEQALYPIFAVLPAVAYEAYRTEGASTKWAARALLGTFVAVILLVLFKVDFDLVAATGQTERTVAGYRVPFGDIKVVGTALVLVLSAILFARTRGVYTKWLAGIIGVTLVAIVYTMAPDALPDLLDSIGT